MLRRGPALHGFAFSKSPCQIPIFQLIIIQDDALNVQRSPPEQSDLRVERTIEKEALQSQESRVIIIKTFNFSPRKG